MYYWCARYCYSADRYTVDVLRINYLPLAGRRADRSIRSHDRSAAGAWTMNRIQWIAWAWVLRGRRLDPKIDTAASSNACCCHLHRLLHYNLRMSSSRSLTVRPPAANAGSGSVCQRFGAMIAHRLTIDLSCVMICFDVLVWLNRK
jgi:hypothetical protein